MSGLQPRHLRRPRPRLPHHVVLLHPGRRRDEPGGLGDLPRVPVPALRGRPGRRVGRRRHGVRREHQPRARPDLGEPGPHRVGVGFDEQRVVEEVPQPHQLRGGLPDGLAGARDVLVVLAARRVAAVRARREHEAVRHPVAGHLGDRVLDERVPVAVAEVDRQIGARPHRRDQLAVAGVQRADPAEVPIVLLDGVQPFGRHAPPAGDVLQERPHVLRSLRAPERQDEQRVRPRPHGSRRPPTPSNPS